MRRTDYCGALREAQTGQTATVMGWSQTKRDMGGVIFIDLRDREGILQVVFDARALSPADFSKAERLKPETVIAVSGVVRPRDEVTFNPRLATGTIELAANELEILSEAQPLPFALDDTAPVREDLRLEYRFLDLRRPEMLQNLRVRHQVVKTARDYLDAGGFLHIETPVLTKSTPEGARDYLVPSRVHPGSFYALPQSPQIFKQLLMVGGVDRYYQIARCFRDEDLRADRQPEFTQVDVELSFAQQEEILECMEGLICAVFWAVKGHEPARPFLRMTWAEAMDRYGSDKPDLRFDLPIIDLSGLAVRCSFSVFRKAAEAGGCVRAITVKGGADFSRSAIEELTEKAMSLGAKGMAWIAIRADGAYYSVLTKYFSAGELEELVQTAQAKPGDFILFCADKLPTVRRVLGGLRLELADRLQLRTPEDRLLFVTDFPQFEYSEEERRFLAMHHPFTMPYPEDIPFLLSDPGRVRAQAYDIILNGVELGGGSIRIHRREVQEKMFEALGFSQQEIDEKFGFLVRAFSYGTPPHGGFALGLDRLVMLLLGAPSLREVIAFPKTKDASCPMTDAPGTVDSEQINILGLDSLSRQTGQSEKSVVRKQAGRIDVKKIAALAKLSLDEEETERMAQEMRQIIAFADRLESLDTTGIEATVQAAPIKNVLRPDCPARPFDRAALLANAPETENGYIFVPQVVE